MDLPGYWGNPKQHPAVPSVWKAEGSALLQPHLAPGGRAGAGSCCSLLCRGSVQNMSCCPQPRPALSTSSSASSSDAVKSKQLQQVTSGSLGQRGTCPHLGCFSSWPGILAQISLWWQLTAHNWEWSWGRCRPRNSVFCGRGQKDI